MQKIRKVHLVLAAHVGSGDDDDRDSAGLAMSAQFPMQLGAAEARQSQIEHDCIRRIVLFEKCESVHAVADRDHAKAGSDEDLAVEMSSLIVILYQ